MYGKFFSSTFTGSMYGFGTDVFAVWGYVIANAVNSRVELNPQLLAAMLGASTEAIEQAISMLCGPDKKSRNQTSGGRRLIKEGRFQYFVVNHETYRAIRNEEERRAYNREKQRESRTRKGVKQNIVENQVSNQMSLTVIDCQSLSTLSANTEAEAEAEALPVVTSNKTETVSGSPPDLSTGRKKINSHHALARVLLDFLNEKTGRNYQPVKANIDMISARLKEGATERQCRLVILRKFHDWGNDEKMQEYLRPATLFNRTKFAQYAGEIPREYPGMPQKPPQMPQVALKLKIDTRVAARHDASIQGHHEMPYKEKTND